MDFLKQYPFITIEQYLWELTVPEVRIMAYDATRIIYLSDKQAKLNKAKKKAIVFDDTLTDEELMTDTGVPVFN